MVYLKTYECLTCELSCLLALQRFAGREMWSFHRIPSRREPTVCFAHLSRLRLHRSALTSLSTGCLAFGNLASGLQNLCLSSGQESTTCHNIQRYKLHRDKKVHLVTTYNVISYIVANFRHGIDPTQIIL